MKKPEELIELLTALRDEVRSSSVMTEDDSRIAVYIGKGTLNLDAAESSLLLNSRSTVTRFFEAIGSPSGASVELYSLAIDDDVKEALDNRFSTVDEL
jgi:hypothetical protein